MDLNNSERCKNKPPKPQTTKVSGASGTASTWFLPTRGQSVGGPWVVRGWSVGGLWLRSCVGRGGGDTDGVAVTHKTGCVYRVGRASLLAMVEQYLSQVSRAEGRTVLPPQGRGPQAVVLPAAQKRRRRNKGPWRTDIYIYIYIDVSRSR